MLDTSRFGKLAKAYEDQLSQELAAAEDSRLRKAGQAGGSRLSKPAVVLALIGATLATLLIAQLFAA